MNGRFEIETDSDWSSFRAAVTDLCYLKQLTRLSYDRLYEISNKCKKCLFFFLTIRNIDIFKVPGRLKCNRINDGVCKKIESFLFHIISFVSILPRVMSIWDLHFLWLLLNLCKYTNSNEMNDDASSFLMVCEF